MDNYDSVDELRTLLKQDLIVPVVGAGVSIATAGVPGWYKLLRTGLSHLKTRRLLSRSKEIEIEGALQQNELTKAATILQKEMGAPGGEYAAWLRHQLDDANWQISDTLLITEILDLPCKLLATTNYDKLLERYDASSRQTVVQTQPLSMVDGIRRGGIFHLHGVYSDPKSVVLGDSDYDEALSNPAYRSAIEAIWMTKSLLFIGCSFDGITDPDFSKLFEWATKTFGPTPHRHFALMLDAAANIQNTRQYLLGDTRLQIVPIGTRHSDLARFIVDINPSRAEARLRRASRVAEFLASPDAVDLASYANVFGPWLPPHKIAEFDAEARIALNQRIEHVERNRTTLNLLRAVCHNLPQKEEIFALYHRWRGISVYDDDAHQTCMAAFTAISIVPRRFLRDLNKREGVVIPGSIVGGLSQFQITQLDAQQSPADRLRAMQNDSYGFELIGRILKTFTIICELLPDTVYPLSLQSDRVDLRGTFFVVGSSNGVSIIDAESLKCTASLQTDGRVRDCAEIEFKGGKALLVLTGDRLLVWDPRRSGLPLIDTPLDSEGFATKIALSAAMEPSEFWVRASQRQLIIFRKATYSRTVELIADLDSFATIDDRLYGSTRHGDIYQLNSDGSTYQIVNRNELSRQVADLRDEVLSFYGWDAEQVLRKLEFLQHAFIQSVRVSGLDALAICFRFDVAADGNSAVLLWRHDKGFFGSWLFEGRVAVLNFAADSTGPCLVVTLLSHFRPDEPLMLWGRPSTDDEPIRFSITQRAASVQNDLFCLTRLGNRGWFAADIDGLCYLISDDGNVVPSDVSVGDSAHICLPLRW